MTLVSRRLLRSLVLLGCVFAVRDACVEAEAVADGTTMDALQRQRVIDGVITSLKGHYVDRDMAQKMAEGLSSHEKNGDCGAISDGCGEQTCG